MSWKTGQSRYQFWLPDTLRERVEQAAKADKRKTSDYIRIVIEAACTKAEEQAVANLAVANNAPPTAATTPCCRD